MTLRDTVLPASQRRTLDEMVEDLDLSVGQTDSKRSAFWTMLIVSAVIAGAGVLSDSTATVIGAMIIAPLSTPIMGVALGVVLRDGSMARSALKFVLLGGLVVVLIGVLFAWITPGNANLFTNSQIAGRTSPGLLDLIAAIATGVAGAVALSRRDVAAVLPGVAISISLVPPLVVVGVCFGQGAFTIGVGALVLFASNFVALVLVGILIFNAAGYSAAEQGDRPLSARRAYGAVGALFVLVLLALAANTISTYAVSLWTDRVQAAALRWVSDSPGAHVEGVDLVSGTFYVRVVTPAGTPSVTVLAQDLVGEVPRGFAVAVSSRFGREGTAVTIGE